MGRPMRSSAMGARGELRVHLDPGLPWYLAVKHSSSVGADVSQACAASTSSVRMRATLGILCLGLWVGYGEAIGLGPLGPQGINLRRLQTARSTVNRFTVQGASHSLSEREVPDYDLDESLNVPSFKVRTLRQRWAIE